MTITLSSMRNWLPAPVNCMPMTTSLPRRLLVGRKSWPSVGTASAWQRATSARCKTVLLVRRRPSPAPSTRSGLQDAVGLELVVLDNNPSDDISVHKVLPFSLVKNEGNLYTFRLDFQPDEAGAYKCAVRMYPKSELLPHRQDFAYVKWLG